MAVILDYSYNFFRILFGNKRAIQENPSFLAHAMLQSLYKTINKFKPTSDNPLYIALDCSKKDNWRYEFFEDRKKHIPVYAQSGATYKGGRVKDESFDWDEIYRILGDLTEAIDQFTDIRVVRHKNAEADDVIYVGSRIHPKTTIISSDKDFAQLHSDTVTQWNPMTEKYMNKDVNASEWLHAHIIMGDKIDGILPIRKGLGPKRAAAMTPQMLRSEIAVDQDMANRHLFNKTLIDMRELPSDIYDEIVENFEESKNTSYNFQGMMKFCQKYRLMDASRSLNKLKFD